MKFHLGNCFYESRTPNPTLRALALGRRPHGVTCVHHMVTPAGQLENATFPSCQEDLSQCWLWTVWGLRWCFHENIRKRWHIFSSRFIGIKFPPEFALSVKTDGSGCNELRLALRSSSLQVPAQCRLLLGPWTSTRAP